MCNAARHTAVVFADPQSCQSISLQVPMHRHISMMLRWLFQQGLMLANNWRMSKKKVHYPWRIHGAAIYGNMDPIIIPQMLAYIPAPWILWVIYIYLCLATVFNVTCRSQGLEHVGYFGICFGRHWSWVNMESAGNLSIATLQSKMVSYSLRNPAPVSFL